jgi:ADP-heptose:LPS heptosyltransferase
MSIFFVLCHSNPGDLVTTRPLLQLLSQEQKTVCIVKKTLYPLISDLGLTRFNYDPPNNQSTNLKNWQYFLSNVKPKSVDTVIDLLGLPALSVWAMSLPCKTIGIQFNYSEILNYTLTRKWSLSSRDLSHVSIRYLRIIDKFKNQLIWPKKVWEQSMFKQAKGLKKSNQNIIALCPGSGSGGHKKRMPSTFWKKLASILRSFEFKIIWFLGPNELNLAKTLVGLTDLVESGDWVSVIKSHSKCFLSYTNDTCHMHIRSFMGLKSFAFFRRNDFFAWGAYPNYLVEAINPPLTNDVEKSLDTSIDFLNRFVSLYPVKI